MKTEIIGICPCCVKQNNGNGPLVDFYAVRENNGDLKEIYIFGDDDFDVPRENQAVTEVEFSNDKKSVIDVVCPRCKEHVSVNIPIIKELLTEKVSDAVEQNTRQQG